MSTKIYTGFVFKTTDFMKIHREIMRFRAAAQQVAIKKCAKVISEMASYQIDRHTLGLTTELEEKQSPRVWATGKVSEMQREIKKTMERNPIVDFSFSLSILPIPGKILGIYYCEDKELEKMWMGGPLVKDYHYQNQSDPPRNVSSKEWNQRERDWDIALPGPGIPSRNGFTADVVDVAGIEYIEGCRIAHKYFISLAERAKKITRVVMWNEWVNARGTSNPVPDYFKYERWIREDKLGKKAFADRIEEIKKKLIPRLTGKHMDEKYT